MRIITSTSVLLSLTACTFDLDDPMGTYQRRANERHPECQQLYGITGEHYEQSMVAYEQGLAADGTPTIEGLLEGAKIPLHTADRLEALGFKDDDLQSLSFHLAAGLRQIAEAQRAMAPFADVERTITSANDRSTAHQASVVQRDEASGQYASALRALEAYCEGKDLPTL
ncbi:MAG: hypothetical protein AAGF93_10295 [Cyanobacteria bacterium P01_H01_bin.105]